MTAIDEYLSKLESPQKFELERIRKIVHDTVPGVTEVISYVMPVFKYKGKYLMGMAAFKGHMSLFPGAYPVEMLQSKLSRYKTSKGTIQFTTETALSEELIKEILHFCLKNTVN